MFWRSFGLQLAYEFLLMKILPQLLDKIEEERVPVILIAPIWPRRMWYTDLLRLLVDKLWPLLRQTQSLPLKSRKSNSHFGSQPSAVRSSGTPFELIRDILLEDLTFKVAFLVCHHVCYTS